MNFSDYARNIVVCMFEVHCMYMWEGGEERVKRNREILIPAIFSVDSLTAVKMIDCSSFFSFKAIFGSSIFDVVIDSFPSPSGLLSEELLLLTIVAIPFVDCTSGDVVVMADATEFFC